MRCEVCGTKMALRDDGTYVCQNTACNHTQSSGARMEPEAKAVVENTQAIKG